VLERLVGDLTIHDQQLLLHDVRCEIVVDSLLHLPLIEVAGHQGHDESDPSDNEKQTEQRSRKLRIQTFHAHSPLFKFMRW
jgi:hypothetical protein